MDLVHARFQKIQLECQQSSYEHVTTSCSIDVLLNYILYNPYYFELNIWKISLYLNGLEEKCS